MSGPATDEMEGLLLEVLNSELSGLLNALKEERVVNSLGEKKSPKAETSSVQRERMFKFMLEKFDDKLYDLEMIIEEPVDDEVRRSLDNMVEDEWLGDTQRLVKRVETDGFVQYEVLARGNANRTSYAERKPVTGFPYVRFWEKRDGVNLEDINRQVAFLYPEEIKSMKLVRKRSGVS